MKGLIFRSAGSLANLKVEELPIPNRNYLTFVLLSPQVAAANPALSQQSLAQSSGGFSFGGLRPGSNAVYLDGVNDDAYRPNPLVTCNG